MSTVSEPGTPTTQVSTPTRTDRCASLIWIASAPAARSSLITSIITSGATPGPGSSIVIMTPGPVAPTAPTRMDNAANLAWALSNAA
ncbi:Uncharacterised protein [Mycobacterium tuberculosis]|uniref:Uncharacterized protein n=1 Tax=Mycobacterium tuberculosis TaxID=1773 RepID=A0A655AAD6_MYCTX|nr:Uncharacterised protein [Mycobacterium tuberculosis]CKU02100.1 Uncharacterised protein [Mycobacterium tuberculosis]